MKTLTIYVLDDYEGDTVEEKTYQCIADGYDAAGHEQDADSDFADNFVMAKDLFEVTGYSLNAGTTSKPVEWKVEIKGNDQVINEYEDILKQVE